MSYLKLANKSDLSGRTLQLMEEAEQRWGYIGSIVRAYALAPNVMEAEDVWTKGVMHSGFLPRKLKEAIATVVSVTNKCDYCAGSHALAYTIAGGDMNEAAHCKTLDLSDFTVSERAALLFAQKSTANPKSIQQTDINTLREHYTDGEIVEISTVIQMFMGYNWFVTIMGLQLEQENPFVKSE